MGSPHPGFTYNPPYSVGSPSRRREPAFPSPTMASTAPLRHSYDGPGSGAGGNNYPGGGDLDAWRVRTERAELRCHLLTEQIKSMPMSLSVAQAEKRVIEAKLEKAVSTYEKNISSVQENAMNKINELKAFMKIQEAEKCTLHSQVQELKSTVHQLTHHLKVLRAQQQPEVTTLSENDKKSYVSRAEIAAMREGIAPPPWSDKVMPM